MPPPSVVAAAAAALVALPKTHVVHRALRTYVLALSLSLGPALLSARSRAVLPRLIARDLGPAGFALPITLAVAAGPLLARLLSRLVALSSSPSRPLPAQRITWTANTLSSFLAILLLHSRRPSPPRATTALPLTVPIPSTRVSPTLDLTLLLLVRALDVVLHATLFRRAHNQPRTPSHTIARVDAFTFWAASARIMWCFFYMPERLPRSYVKWITSLADMDKRLIYALQAVRAREWSYITGVTPNRDLVASLATDLGYPAVWGDPMQLPAWGGRVADEAWAALGLRGRNGVGGIPCHLVHGTSGAGPSCVGNAGIRWIRGFSKALLIYLPVHALPTLLTRPTTLLHPARISSILIGTLRSSSFLATFISSVWLAVCLTRSLLLARLFPFVSHDVWDGPYGAILAGSLACGGSIALEQGRRRGEMALYVLPRAVRTCLPERWIRKGSKAVWLERAVFAMALSTLLTSSVYRPEALRGLSRWTLQFIMHGPNTGFWPGQARAPKERTNANDTHPSHTTTTITPP